jgi:hypothetical protein
MAERRPYPPLKRNKFNFDDGQAPFGDIENQEVAGFGLTQAMLATAASGAYLGWLTAKPVPLLPGWLGAVTGAGMFGYATSVQNRRGDLLRYLGHSMLRSYSTVASTAADVQLQDSFSLLCSHLMFFSKSVDSKYNVVARLKAIFVVLLSQLNALSAK